MYAFVDKQRDAFGVEPVCEVLQIAPSAYRRYAARSKDPSLLSPRAQRDAALAPKIEAVWNANFQVYGADKIWTRARRHPRPPCGHSGLARCVGRQGYRLP